MEDVQDGKKVSIQDGVTEDPELLERLDIKGKSIASLYYISGELGNPTIESILETTTDSEDFVCSIVTVLGTAVT